MNYILIKNRFQHRLLSIKIRPGADFYSDHVPANLRLKLKKIKEMPVKIWNYFSQIRKLKKPKEIHCHYAEQMPCYRKDKQYTLAMAIAKGVKTTTPMK